MGDYGIAGGEEPSALHLVEAGHRHAQHETRAGFRPGGGGGERARQRGAAFGDLRRHGGIIDAVAHHQR